MAEPSGPRQHGEVSSIPVAGPQALTPRADPRNYAWHLRGVVVASPAGPVVRVRGHDYPMPAGTPHAPGDELRLKLVFKSGWQLQIVGPAGAGAAGGSAAPLLSLLAQLDLPTTAEVAARLLPAHLPPSAEAVSTLIHRLAAADGAGPALAKLFEVMNEAAARGVPVSSAHLAAVTGWLIAPLGSAERWRGALRKASGPSPESVLGDLLGEASVDGLRSLERSPEQVWAELAADEALLAFVRERGEQDEWCRALAELAGRTDGDRLLGLHGLTSPYRFIDLAVDPTTGWRRAQVHLLGGERSVATVVLDLATDDLGDIWLALRVGDHGGVLRVQAERAQTLEDFAAHGPELTDLLAGAGYPGVAVSFEGWDGDRLRAAVDLFQTVNPIRGRGMSASGPPTHPGRRPSLRSRSRYGAGGRRQRGGPPCRAYQGARGGERNHRS